MDCAVPPLVPVLLELPLKEGVRPSHHCVFSVVICVEVCVESCTEVVSDEFSSCARAMERIEVGCNTKAKASSQTASRFISLSVLRFISFTTNFVMCGRILFAPTIDLSLTRGPDPPPHNALVRPETPGNDVSVTFSFTETERAVERLRFP